jgi:hypothetical protein
MEKKKIEKIISIIREQMVANAAGAQGGFSSDSPDPGPVAGRSPKMFLLSRKFAKTYAKSGPGSRKKWLDYLKSHDGRRS